MASTNDPRARDPLARHVPTIAAAVVVGAAVPIGILRGAPTVVLWVAFALLSAAVLIFWEALRTALDPAAPGDDDDTDESGVPSDLEARKRAALKALKDIEFERAIGRLSEEDHKELDAKYRAEARAAMRAIDEGLGPWLSRAESMLDEAVKPADAKAADVKSADAKLEPEAAKPALSLEKKPDAAPSLACPKCEAANDADAVFCKKCGARVAPEAADAN
ncbi:MAG: zinc ribbon domain-containing protein [Polyangiales bacterium]